MNHKPLLFALLLSPVMFMNTLFAQEAVASNGKFATIKGLKLYYEEYGDGMPFIILHGFSGSATAWKPFVPEFEKHYRVIAVDLPGHSRSDYMDTTRVYLHRRAAEYILGLADHLGLDSVYVMGHSSGGFIATYMATMRPDLVKKIIVVNGQIYYSAQTRAIIEDCCGSPPGKALIDRHGQEKAILLRKQFYHFRLLHGDPSFTSDMLASIKAKAFIIHGDEDQIAPVFNAWEMFTNIPGANLWVVPNGGHAPIFDQNNQADFTRTTLEFLRGDWDKK